MIEPATDIAAVRALFERYAASLPFDLAYQDFAAELAGLPAPYAPPGGVLLVARGGLGVVGVKQLAPGIAEIKRLYVVPEARGRGLGEALLRRAIDAARLSVMHASASTATARAWAARSRFIAAWALSRSRLTAPIWAGRSRFSK